MFATTAHAMKYCVEHSPHKLTMASLLVVTAASLLEAVEQNGRLTNIAPIDIIAIKGASLKQRINKLVSSIMEEEDIKNHGDKFLPS